MKIMFLHISDMHIKNMGGFNKFQIEKIVDAAISAGTVDHIILVVSGDLSFSGKFTEYTVVKKCINNIINGYKAKSHHLNYIQIPVSLLQHGNRNDGNVTNASW